MTELIDVVMNYSGDRDGLEEHYQNVWGLVQYKWGLRSLNGPMISQQVAAALVKLDLGTYSCCRLLLLFGRFISQVHPFLTFGHVHIVLTAQAVFLVCLHFALKSVSASAVSKSS